jgi:hypothetical protein
VVEKSLVAIFFLFTAVGCGQDKPPTSRCNQSLIKSATSFHSLINSLPNYVIEGLTKKPDADGALGRNLNGYFHVRFQMDIGFLASYAVKFNSDDALENFIRATEYSFNRQKTAGDFELMIPDNLQYLGQPSAGDLASGTSFFLSALGSSLVLLTQSNWFNARPSDNLKGRLNQLTPKFQLAIAYLKTQKEVLKKYDDDAPNRLLFDALAFYGMGMYLNDAEAKSIGIEFVQLALSKQNEAGFFTEGGGFDSSYNGVSMRLGLILLGIIPVQDGMYAPLQKALSCGVQWQASRVLPSGEISLEGNTRVYPGGEKFLGAEKEIAWIDTLLAFYFTAAISSSSEYTQLAKQVEDFYN